MKTRSRFEPQNNYYRVSGVRGPLIKQEEKENRTDIFEYDVKNMDVENEMNNVTFNNVWVYTFRCIPSPRSNLISHVRDSL